MAILDDLQTKLISDNVAGGATGWGIGKAYMPDSSTQGPNQFVALYERGGEYPRKEHERLRIQVLVRGNPYEYDVARAKAASVIASLDDATISGVVFIYLSSSIELFSSDTNNRPFVSINFDVFTQR